MDDDKSSRFVELLVKSIQSFCDVNVFFTSSVQIIGHIHLSIDSGKNVDYVLTEEISKTVNRPGVIYSSSSYHSKPTGQIQQYIEKCHGESLSRNSKKELFVTRIDDKEDTFFNLENNLKISSNSQSENIFIPIASNDFTLPTLFAESCPQNIVETDNVDINAEQLITYQSLSSCVDLVDIKQNTEVNYVCNSKSPNTVITSPLATNIGDNNDVELQAHRKVDDTVTRLSPVMVSYLEHHVDQSLAKCDSTEDIGISDGEVKKSVDYVSNERDSKMHFLRNIPRRGQKHLPQRVCKVCKQEGRRQKSCFYCPGCLGQPSFCKVRDCFSRYHMSKNLTVLCGEECELDDVQKNVDKEECASPSHAPKPSDVGRNKMVKTTSCYRDYTNDDVNEAIELVHRGTPVSDAALAFGIPRATLFIRSRKGCNTHSGRCSEVFHQNSSNCKLRKRSESNYTKETLEQAIGEVHNGMPVIEASILYQIPRASLFIRSSKGCKSHEGRCSTVCSGGKLRRTAPEKRKYFRLMQQVSGRSHNCLQHVRLSKRSVAEIGDAFGSTCDTPKLRKSVFHDILGRSSSLGHSINQFAVTQCRYSDSPPQMRQQFESHATVDSETLEARGDLFLDIKKEVDSSEEDASTPGDTGNTRNDVTCRTSVFRKCDVYTKTEDSNSGECLHGSDVSAQSTDIASNVDMVEKYVTCGGKVYLQDVTIKVEEDGDCQAGTQVPQ